MTLSMSDKWMRAAGLLVTAVSRPNSSASGAKITTSSSDLKFTSTETGIEFKKVAKSAKSLSKKDYDCFLESLVKRKLPPNGSLEESRNKVKASLALAPKPSGGVNKSSGSGSSSTDVVSRLTDVTKYTGSHKYRFDQTTGKGRGKEGRE
jgi:hypothetical protein